MISTGHPQDFHVRRGNQANTRLRTGAQAEAEVRTGRDQLPKGPARNCNLSRRHTKLAKRQAEPEGPRQPNHQPQWKEATVMQAHAEEEVKLAP